MSTLKSSDLFILSNKNTTLHENTTLLSLYLMQYKKLL